MDTPDSTTLKRCSKCGELKPLDGFHRDKNAKDGAAWHCKACVCKRVAEWSQTNPERKRESDKRYRENNREARLQQKRDYYQNNKERHRETGERWRENNRERYKKYQANYYEVRRQEKCEYARRYRLTANGKVSETINRQKRRARKQSAFGTHTARDLHAIRVAQTDKRGRVHCWWCGKVMSGWHVDHKIALAVGGSNDAGNLCLSCPRCNTSKHTKTPQEFNGRLF